MAEFLSTQGLCHSFADGSLGLDSVDFHIGEGEFVLLAGRNGSGKTLLARHLAGLARPSRGLVSFRGRPLKEAMPELRRALGFVFQDTDSQILGQTVAEDVAFGPSNLGLKWEEIEQRSRRSLGAANLAGKEDRRPETLSGGEKRRLAIAGALAMEPECLILDEPFANLDLDSVNQVSAICGTLKERGIALLVVTHELEKVFSLADRLVVLEGGRKVFDGNPHQAEPEFFSLHGLACPYEGYWPWSVRRSTPSTNTPGHSGRS